MTIYAIECCGPKNESFIFAPERIKVRGRWDSSKIAHRDLDEVMKQITMLVPVIPGQYIILDTSREVGHIVDPLGSTPEGKEVLAKLQSVYKQYPETTGGSTTFIPEVKQKLDHDGMKNWAYAMRRLIDSKNAVLASFPGAAVSNLPSLEEIAAWPGKRLADPLNTGEQSAKTPEQADQNNGIYKYADEVAIPSKSSKASAKAADGGPKTSEGSAQT